jgi:acetolactate synthase-1/2/3 large subunit
MTGADSFVAALRAAGVSCVFGYPGATALPLFDALYGADDIRLVLSRHEQGATFMAGGWARATGRTGVVLVTSGPGATNTVTAIADAYMDSIPLVVFTAQVPSALIGTDAFQESDITGITLPITKHSYLVKSADEIAPTVAKALYLAATGRRGPVVVDIPVDVAEGIVGVNGGSDGAGKSDGDGDSAARLFTGYDPRPQPDPALIAQAAAALTAAKHPVILAGGGVIAAEACHLLTDLARTQGIPVVTTLMGRGAFPEDDLMWLGMPGLFGHAGANEALSLCDVLLAVGTRFAERIAEDPAAVAPDATVIHIDVDAAELGKQRRADVAINADAADALTALLRELPDGCGEASPDSGASFSLRTRAALADTDVLIPAYVVGMLDALTQKRTQQGKATIRVTEVGQNQLWAARHSRVTRPRSFLTSGGLGAMGFGLPTAIGAQLACPDALVLNISGDGSFLMNVQELATAVAVRAAVKVFILNNAGLGLVRQWQDMKYAGRHVASELPVDQPDFAALATAFGAVGLTVATPADFEVALRRALESDGPVVVDCRIDPTDIVEMQG